MADDRIFHLGERVDPATHERSGEPIHYEADDLTTHGVVVGMTGSGKTGLGIVLLEEALLDGIPALIIDPKGDLGNLLLTFPELAPDDFAPWVGSGTTPEEAATTWTEGLASWDIGPERIAALRDAADFEIYTPGSTSGVPLNVVGSLEPPEADDAEARQEEIEGYVSGLLGLVGIEADPISSPEHILLANLIDRAWSAGETIDLAALVGQVQDPPIRKLGVLELDAFFPAKDRNKLATKLNGLVASPAFAAWGSGESLDIDALLGAGDGAKPRAAIVSLSHLSDEERQFVVTLLLSKLVTWMRGQSGTENLRALVYMDEVFGFVPPSAAPPSKKPILTILKQARAFGVGMVLATQNPVDVDYKALSNAGTWMIGRLQTERDKARLLEGMEAVSGEVDMGTLDATISSLAKREFILHRTGTSEPTVFTTRWAMSYLRGPLTREQISELTADSPARQAASAAAEAPAAQAPEAQPAPVGDASPASAAAGTAAGPAPSASAPQGTAPAVAPAVAAGEDDTPGAPEVAPDIPVRYLDPAAGWAAAVGAVSAGTRLEAAIVARVHLTFDDEKAGIDTDQEYEAVVFPLPSEPDADEAVAVDYDDRDLRTEAPSGARFVLPDAKIHTKTFFRSFQTDLKDLLYRQQTVTVFRNEALDLYGRPGESDEEFATRCAAAAEDEADKEAAALTEKLRKQAGRVEAAIAKAADRVEELEVDKSTRKRDTIVGGLGSLASAVLGGRKSSTSIARSMNSVLSKQGMASRAGQRLETAKNRLDDKTAELADLEADLADQLIEIADRWDDASGAVDSVEIGLEKTDISVDEVVLVWVPTA